MRLISQDQTQHHVHQDTLDFFASVHFTLIFFPEAPVTLPISLPHPFLRVYHLFLCNTVCLCWVFYLALSSWESRDQFLLFPLSSMYKTSLALGASGGRSTPFLLTTPFLIQKRLREGVAAWSFGMGWTSCETESEPFRRQAHGDLYTDISPCAPLKQSWKCVRAVTGCFL